ncbi:MAG: CheY-P-specific phosphatase CheC [Firmicutes bacterium]|nr:CheY-P-specific phosphatase CheC [Bacillota bacterium]
MHYDVLKEVGNIGAGNAATALAALLNQQIKMQVPNVAWLPFDEVADRLGGAEEPVAGILLNVESDAPSTILVVFPLQQAYFLLDILFSRPLGQSDTIDEVGASALEEVGNILAGSYLTSLSSFTGLTFVPMVPAIAVDMAGAVLDYVLAEFGQIADQVLLIETEFQALGEDIYSYFFLVPKADALKAIFAALGVDYT